MKPVYTELRIRLRGDDPGEHYDDDWMNAAFAEATSVVQDWCDMEGEGKFEVEAVDYL